MFELKELKQTKVYREAFEEGYQEGKLIVVPVLLKAGIEVEEIAQQLRLDLNAIRQIASQQQPD
ncbi:MAG: hypothetical protein KME17_27325 [Cyanosarcina radialis HA8281-LM2]|jgi:predicted transposase YdaD|nr:hypothetical protein [Cyanosarcina radialis HA8281-LM2]